ncbi:hypothetical protein ONS95_013777 [Cadophora gregata]|uniref:uncharacterized protein n=1 Tax=Cadophora gregata TaxID=51156 RepID=UPI0026DBB1BC|nr:uncharacterized protein ONS95_013777 [Cadophora gregata]KAK0113523.1 hypothetical protein ONS96_014384 [Cadophora gregata f. sp. sojae]KAK0114282.1 hypothetical protein ONS95_013777 [Cadophora gregata]
MSSQERTLSTSQCALLPRSKIDTDAVEQIAGLDAITLEPLVPDLLRWIQDANWPIAWPIIELLRKHPLLLVEPIRKILRDEAGEKDDGEWKYNCLASLVAEMDTEHRILFKEELARMAKSPTLDEKEWETAATAKAILEEFGVTFKADDKSPNNNESFES